MDDKRGQSIREGRQDGKHERQFSREFESRVGNKSSPRILGHFSPFPLVIKHLLGVTRSVDGEVVTSWNSRFCNVGNGFQSSSLPFKVLHLRPDLKTNHQDGEKGPPHAGTRSVHWRDPLSEEKKLDYLILVYWKVRRN